MALAVILPKLDEAMRTGKIVKWLKKEGDRVEKGDVILEVETEKVTVEIEAEQPGILSKLLAQVGEDVPVGKIVVFILEPGEKMPEVAEAAPAGSQQAQLSPAARRDAGTIRATPVARKLAEEHNIELSKIVGTGPEGRIGREDVLRAVEERKAITAAPAAARLPTAPVGPESAQEEIVPLSSMRKVIARRMTESFETPHFYITVDVDARDLVKSREQMLPLVESETSVRLTITDFIVKMVARALQDNPYVNCAYTDGAVKLFKRIDIGLVVAVEGGLIVPVIRQANKKSLAEIAKERAALIQKASEGRLSLQEMRGSTFTISNMGMYEVDQFSAILQPPEAAILAVGRIAERPSARNGQIVIRPMMTLTLSLDHRVLDAVMGANFLKSLKGYIENPATVF